jgi:translation initiation factor 4A
MSSENETSTFESWDDVNMSMKLLRGIYSYGFEKPSAIQKQSVLPFKNGRDVIAQAQSGTGKTGAFTVGVLSRVDAKKNQTQALILSPTKELSLQNFNVANALSSYMKLNIYHAIGGVPVQKDSEYFSNTTPQIVLGTPGRINDLINRGILKTEHISMFVLDEADEMLSKGFKEQIHTIFQFMPKEVQVGLFSATMPSEVMEITKNFMQNPHEIYVKSDMLTLEGIKQYYVLLEDDQQKYATIKDIYSMFSVSQTIIYCNSVKRVTDLTDALRADEFPVVCIHSNMNTNERLSIYNDFKAGQYRVLISSDVTARGIDVQQVSVVINFDIPHSKHTYLHRIGRSGRFGRKGTAINFVSERDYETVKEIENWYQTKFEELPAKFGDE